MEAGRVKVSISCNGLQVRERSHIMSAAEGGRGGKPLLTYHCSNKTKTIEIADIGGEGGQKLENLADIICERSLS